MSQMERMYEIDRLLKSRRTTQANRMNRNRPLPPFPFTNQAAFKQRPAVTDH